MRLYTISMDPPEKSREFIAKIEADGKGKIDFRILSDPGARTIDAYGLRDPAYAGKDVDGIPHPSVYILDRRGVVRWARVGSPRVRPPVADVRRALDAVR